MQKTFPHIVACSLLTLLLACGSGNSQNVLDLKAFKEKAGHSETIVLDVRTPAEFSRGHLPGALNANVEGEDFGEKIKEFDKSKTYLLYCQSGARAHQAAEKLEKAGFQNIFELKGGFPDWQKAGYPVEK